MTATSIGGTATASGIATTPALGGQPPHTAAPSLPSEVRAEFEQRLSEGELELPLLPGVALEVTSAAAREDVDARRLAELLKRDAAMAAHVLRVVNSPLYGGRGPIVGLQQAVARVGAAKIREIALIVACRASVFQVPGFEAAVDAIFRHSVMSALIGQEIARSTRSNVEDAFLCGLLHDIGRPVLIQSLVSIAAKRARALDHEAVHAFANELHCRTGVALALGWGLPESVQLAISRHHEPLGEAQPTSIHITALADAVAHAVAAQPAADAAALLALDAGSATPLTSHASLARLEIYPDVLQRILTKAVTLRETAKALS